MTITAKWFRCSECGTRFRSTATQSKCCGVVAEPYRKGPRKLDTGSTTRGRAQFKPVIPRRDPSEFAPLDVQGKFSSIRVIAPTHGHATKRHRGSRVRLIGGNWVKG